MTGEQLVLRLLTEAQRASGLTESRFARSLGIAPTSYRATVAGLLPVRMAALRALMRADESGLVDHDDAVHAILAAVREYRGQRRRRGHGLEG